MILRERHYEPDTISPFLVGWTAPVLTGLTSKQDVGQRRTQW
jgi:hypothetical protein